MKFYASIAAGPCTICFGFEPDADPGTKFTPEFKISAGYLKKIWIDLDEI